MKVAILSRNARLYSTKRLVEAARSRGHKVKVFDTLSFSINVDEEGPELYYKNKPLPTYDAVIPRIGSSITFFGTSVVRQFEQMGVYSMNPATSITMSRDKLRALQLLSRHKVGIAPTAFVRQRSDVMPAIKAVGGAPVVIKLLEGTQGIGVILAETNKIAEAIVETLQSAKQNALIQKFIRESQGTDVRAFVVGGQVVAAMRRTAPGGEFRSNVHRGGSVEPVQLSPQLEKTAIRAAQILNLNVAGVDMLEADKGPMVLEVNSSPGLEGIERATQLDVAGTIIDFVARESSFPHLDLRERFTLDRGYGVGEILIDKKIGLIGKTLQASGLREQDIVVLRLMRSDGTTISNPKPERLLKRDDVLLCFGKLDTMRTLVKKPKLKPRKRKFKEMLGPDGD